MYIACIVLIFIASILLILAVLSQSPKGGMAANFGASNAVMGVRQTADFLEKSTWGLAIAILLLSLVATMTMPKDRVERSRTGVENAIIDQVETSGQEVIPNQVDVPAEAEAETPTEATPAAEATGETAVPATEQAAE
ncbi:MAG: preprotein translocase subunit SecG [Alistipes sp.]|nr:preprotein translocase subunit SecG [Alistipes sp.]